MALARLKDLIFRPCTPPRPARPCCGRKRGERVVTGGVYCLALTPLMFYRIRSIAAASRSAELLNRTCGKTCDTRGRWRHRIPPLYGSVIGLASLEAQGGGGLPPPPFSCRFALSPLAVKRRRRWSEKARGVLYRSPPHGSVRVTWLFGPYARTASDRAATPVTPPPRPRRIKVLVVFWPR
jgi:hypothetical protein